MGMAKDREPPCWRGGEGVNLKDKETIERALGIIEGVSYGVSDAVAGALIDAVQRIEGALEGGGGKDHEQYV